jgi:hypothetical protein
VAYPNDASWFAIGYDVSIESTTHVLSVLDDHITRYGKALAARMLRKFMVRDNTFNLMSLNRDIMDAPLNLGNSIL